MGMGLFFTVLLLWVHRMAKALLKFFLSFAQIVKQSSKLTVRRGFKPRSKLFGEPGHAVEVIGQRLPWVREDWI